MLKITAGLVVLNRLGAQASLGLLGECSGCSASAQVKAVAVGNSVAWK
jgi:hypothetical protein